MAQLQQGGELTQVRARFLFLFLSCFGICALILFRAAYIQLIGHPKLEALAKRQYQSHALIRPRRGFILDRNGEPLAVNVEVQSLAANPNKVLNKRTLARLISQALRMPASRVAQKLSEKREFVWIKRHLSESESRRLRHWRIVDSNGELVEGLWMVKESDRVYPHGPLAAQILGGVNVDSEGIEGLELWMNDRLRGTVGSVSALKDALGRPTFIDAAAAKTVRDGENVQLTIDAPLQFEVEEELKSAVQRTGSRSGTVIVLNATNGEILALANEPTFNPNFKHSPIENRRNRALTDGYEPGSTFKAILLASALSNGWKLSDKIWGERGSLVVQGHKISEAETHEKFEWLTLKKLIQVSSNVASAKVALKLGAESYLRTIRLLGFGNKTGTGFPGELSGKVLSTKEWGPLTLANVGFGQGIFVTPMQMATAYAAIANGGWLVQPKLLKKSSAADDPMKDHGNDRGNFRVLSHRVSEQVVDALEAVTQPGGTGIRAAVEGIRIAGKTGTSQMVDPKSGRYARDKHIASFIGFPSRVAPKIVVYVSLTEPKGSYYAAGTAAPLFKEVMTSVAHRFSLPTEDLPIPRLLAHLPVVDQVQLAQAHPVTEEVAFDGPDTQNPLMPSLKGLSVREAIRTLRGYGVKINLVGWGVVRGQFPEAGKPLAQGRTVRLILSEQ